MIPDETIAEVRDRVDIVGLVGRYVDLKKAGTLYKACCPFHQERTPSFTVTPSRGTYHCFGCEAHGDAIKFVREMESIGFAEAVRRLAREVGVEVPEARPMSAAQKAAKARRKTLEERLLGAQDALAAYYTNTLFGPAGGPGRAYLEGRGITRRAAEAFRLGWATGDKAEFQGWARAKGIARDDLVSLGVLVAPEEGWRPGEVLDGGYLRFRERVMFPVVDVRGEVVGFGGRIVRDQKAAKYINSPETPVYTKGRHVYGGHTARTGARKSNRVVLCEGNIDVVSLWQSGMEGTVAAMGTALTEAQVRIVKRLSPNVVCLMDGDAAGRKAAFGSLLSFLGEGVEPRAVMLPDGEDPDSYVASNGIDALTARLDEARPLFDLFIEDVSARHPADNPGRIAALGEVAPALIKLDDPLTRTLYRRQVADALRIDAEIVEAAEGQAKVRAEEQAARSARRKGQWGQRGQGQGGRGSVGQGSVGQRSQGLGAPQRSGAGGQRGQGRRFEPHSASDPEFHPGFEGPPPEAMEPLPGPMMPAPPTGLVGPPPEAFERRRIDEGLPPQHELEAADLILQFPEHAAEFAAEGGVDSLTHTGLADFLSRLCERAREGDIDVDRFLFEVHDTPLRTFFVTRHGRKPTQTEDTALQAIREAAHTLRWQKLRQARADARQRYLVASRENRPDKQERLAEFQEAQLALSNFTRSDGAR